MRTTSSLEPNNLVMNNCVVNHGNFFSFVRDLRIQEFQSSLKFKQYCESGGIAKLPQNEYKVNITISCQAILAFVLKTNNSFLET